MANSRHRRAHGPRLTRLFHVISGSISNELVHGPGPLLDYYYMLTLVLYFFNQSNTYT